MTIDRALEVVREHAADLDRAVEMPTAKDTAEAIRLIASVVERDHKETRHAGTAQ